MSELQGLQTRTEDFEAAGVQLIAVSVDPVERNLETAEKLGVSFPILSDAEANAAIEAFGVRHEAGGMGGVDIARPAVFLIDDGVIRWRQLTDNWRIRARPDELLETIAKLDTGS